MGTRLSLIKNISNFSTENYHITRSKKSSLLHGQVFMMGANFIRFDTVCVARLDKYFQSADISFKTFESTSYPLICDIRFF